MQTTYKSAQETAQERIDQIIKALAIIESEIDIDPATADWPTVGSLGAIAQQLQETVAFCTGTEQ